MNSLKILDIFIGGKCNLACFQCDTRSDVIRTNEYDQDIDTMLDGIKLAQQHFKIEMYSMLGGEPLMYLPQVKKLVAYIKKTDPTAYIIMPTNGTLLHKHKTELADLLLNYNVSLFVCNHFAGFKDTRLSKKVVDSALQFSKELNLLESNAVDFNRNLFGIDITERENSFTGKEYVFTNGKMHVWIRDQKEFHSHYYMDNGIPKPFISGNPAESYKQGCCSPMCSFLFEGKLYKCAALGTLKKFLKSHNLLNDLNWQKYLAYEPLNLSTATPEEIKDFSDTKFSAKPECDMCPSSDKHIFVKTEEKVINFIKDMI
jgi:organic radical activating enzyme